MEKNAELSGQPTRPPKCPARPPQVVGSKPWSDFYGDLPRGQPGIGFVRLRYHGQEVGG